MPIFPPKMAFFIPPFFSTPREIVGKIMFGVALQHQIALKNCHFLSFALRTKIVSNAVQWLGRGNGRYVRGLGIKMIPPTTGVKRIKRDTGLGGGGEELYAKPDVRQFWAKMLPFVGAGLCLGTYNRIVPS